MFLQGGNCLMVAQVKRMAFAKKQTKEIQSMGFSHTSARNIVRMSGPRLASTATNWADIAWKKVREEILTEKEAAKSSGDAERRQFGWSPTTRHEVTFHLQQTIDSALEGLNMLDTQCSPEAQKTAMMKAEDALENYSLDVPSDDPFRLRRILEGAHAAAAALAQEFVDEPRDMIIV